jgi:hypothetical protein
MLEKQLMKETYYGTTEMLTKCRRM